MSPFVALLLLLLLLEQLDGFVPLIPLDYITCISIVFVDAPR